MERMIAAILAAGLFAFSAGKASGQTSPSAMGDIEELKAAMKKCEAKKQKSGEPCKASPNQGKPGEGVGTVDCLPEAECTESAPLTS